MHSLLSLSLVFSGLMYKSNFSIRRIPEVVAHSGATLLHFFSDDAYNMSGFNISYRFDSCPTTDSCKYYHTILIYIYSLNAV